MTSTEALYTLAKSVNYHSLHSYASAANYAAQESGAAESGAAIKNDTTTGNTLLNQNTTGDSNTIANTQLNQPNTHLNQNTTLPPPLHQDSKMHNQDPARAARLSALAALSIVSFQSSLENKNHRLNSPITNENSPAFAPTHDSLNYVVQETKLSPRAYPSPNELGIASPTVSHATTLVSNSPKQVRLPSISELLNPMKAIVDQLDEATPPQRPILPASKISLDSLASIASLTNHHHSSSLLTTKNSRSLSADNSLSHGVYPGMDGNAHVRSKSSDQSMAVDNYRLNFSSQVPTPSTTTPSTGTSKKIISGPHKSLRYDVLKNGTPVQRMCGDCSSNHTSGHWCQDPLVVGGYICQKCYRRRKRSQGPNGKTYTPPSRCCADCKSNKSTVWFRHASIMGKYICQPCHNATHELVAFQDSKSKKCHGCGSGKSTKWTTDSKGYVCRKCSRQLLGGNEVVSRSLTSSPALSCSSIASSSAFEDEN